MRANHFIRSRISSVAKVAPKLSKLNKPFAISKSSKSFATIQIQKLSTPLRQLSTPLVPFARFHASKQMKQEEKPSEEKTQEEAKPQTDEGKIISELQQKIEDLTQSLKYSYAERENVRKIGKDETEKAREYGIQNFAKSLLDVSDNFARCLAAVKKEEVETIPAFKTFYEGVQMTEKIMLKAFKSHGLEKFDPTGTKFDPNTMNALSFIHILQKKTELLELQ